MAARRSPDCRYFKNKKCVLDVRMLQHQGLAEPAVVHPFSFGEAVVVKNEKSASAVRDQMF